MNETATPIHPTLLLIETANLDAVPVFLLDRSATRKVQAAAARALFKQLGLKGISVTAPNYSMASMVHVNLPRTEASKEMIAEWNASEFQSETAYGRLRSREHEAHRKLGQILAKAFPNHLDRSDVMSDYFDSCWSIS